MSHNQSLARRAKKGSKNQIRLPPILKGKKAGDPLALISPVTDSMRLGKERDSTNTA